MTRVEWIEDKLRDDLSEEDLLEVANEYFMDIADEPIYYMDDLDEYLRGYSASEILQEKIDFSSFNINECYFRDEAYGIVTSDYLDSWVDYSELAEYMDENGTGYGYIDLSEYEDEDEEEDEEEEI